MLILHFDYPSPPSAVALLRLQRIVDLGGAVRFAGLDTLGLDVAVPPTLDQLAEVEAWRDRAREAGLILRRPGLRPPTVRAHLIGDLADEVDLGASWRGACLVAYWAEGRDIGDVDVLVDLAAAVGLDPHAARARAEDRSAIAGSRQRAIAQRQRGIGGVPVLEVDGTLLSAQLDERQLRELASL